MDIKEESCLIEFSSENEREFSTEDLAKKVKIETSDSNTKPELEEDSTCSQHHLMGFNTTIKEGEVETKIDIKQEHWWLERETSCIKHDIKGETHEDWCSTKPPSEYDDAVSTYASGLFSKEHLENCMCFNKNQDSADCGGDRKCQSQKSVISGISSLETNVCSETSNDGKTVSMAFPAEQSKVLWQSNTNTQGICKSILDNDYVNSHRCDVSKTRFKSSSHVEKQGLVFDSKQANQRDVWDKNYKLIGEEEKLHKCNICNKRFTLLQNLRRHKLIHEGIKPHNCNVCNRPFARLSDLKRHKSIHEYLKPHQCNVCKKAFSQLSNLKTHKLIHEDLKLHECNICYKTFRQISNFKRHKMTHEDLKLHKCNICNNSFSLLEYLKKHKLIHKGIKPHKCTVCNKAFTQSSSLSTHRLIHEHLKPHKCNICNTAFTQKTNLRRHKLIHEGTKPYKCNICNKAFTQSSCLKTHKLIHEGIKPHKCNICSKAFTDLSGLKKHKLIHEGIKPCMCNICNKTFTQSSTLKRHELTHKDAVV